MLSHSYGALASLVALDRLTTVSHLILYEPPVFFDRPDSDAVIASLERALEANDREEIVTSFLRDQVRAPAERIAHVAFFAHLAYRASNCSHAATRVARCQHLSAVDGTPRNWKTPTTVLLGSETTGLLRDAAFGIRDAIPGCRLVVLEGQGHGAMLDAPEFFANKILEIA